jgi:hypothetical protein
MMNLNLPCSKEKVLPMATLREHHVALYKEDLIRCIISKTYREIRISLGDLTSVSDSTTKSKTQIAKIIPVKDPLWLGMKR